MNLGKLSILTVKVVVVINPTMLPTRKRNTPFAIPTNISLRYDIIMI